MTNKLVMQTNGKLVAEESEVPKRGRGRPAKYPWATIDIGESFDAPTISTVGMKSASKRLNRTFAIDQLTDDVVKITRIE